MAWDGYDNTKGYNSQIVSGTQAIAEQVKAIAPPLLEMKHWEKTPTWAIVTSGTTSNTSANNLVDSGANFVSAGVTVGMIVKNTTDNTFAIVNSVAATTLGLRADTRAGTSSGDIFTLGENYTIYLQYELSDAWAECNGQVINDSESPWNGKTLPNLNASGGGTKRFLKGSTSSGTTGTGNHGHRTFYADTASGLLSYDSAGNQTANIGAESTSGSNNVSGIDQAAVNGYLYTSQDVGDVPHYEGVIVMRIK